MTDGVFVALKECKGTPRCPQLDSSVGSVVNTDELQQAAGLDEADSGQQKKPIHELVSEVSAPLSAAKWCDDRSNNA